MSQISSKKNISSPSSHSHITRMWIILLSAIILFFLTLFAVDRSHRSQINALKFSAAVEAYVQSKRDFCYDRSIVPCNDDKLHDWNNTHSADTFRFKTSDEIGKDAGL